MYSCVCVCVYVLLWFCVSVRLCSTNLMWCVLVAYGVISQETVHYVQSDMPYHAHWNVPMLLLLLPSTPETFIENSREFTTLY